ncbi:hypothetical protein CMUS01_16460, partial [Colletotrichum musicola]
MLQPEVTRCDYRLATGRKRLSLHITTFYTRNTVDLHPVTPGNGVSLNITNSGTQERSSLVEDDADDLGRIKRRRLNSPTADAIPDVLQRLEEDFARKVALSENAAWATPVSIATKVDTVQSFYKAFTDSSTLPLETCRLCYRKFGNSELVQIPYETWKNSHRMQSSSRVVPCCEHLFPPELADLTAVEEKLIALNSSYGFITRFNLPKGCQGGPDYVRHVRGHITVFPNNVADLVTKVLPHPLVKVLDNIHVSWQGPEKPLPKDISKLASVRRHAVEKALVWLKQNNPLYRDIEIDYLEMATWEDSEAGVPKEVYRRLERHESTAREKIFTAPIVPPEARGLEAEGPVDINQLLASLHEDDERGIIPHSDV